MVGACKVVPDSAPAGFLDGYEREGWQSATSADDGREHPRARAVAEDAAPLRGSMGPPLK